MKKIVVIYTLGIGLFIAVSFSLIFASEDSDDGTSQVTLTILPAFNLDIEYENVSVTLSGNPEVDNAFDAGYVDLDANKPTLIVNANKAWKLTAKSSGFTGPYSKDISELHLRDLGSVHVTDEFEDFSALSSSDQEIALHTSGVKDEEHPCQYRILLDWTKDVPGTYEATVTYTLATNGA